MSASSVNCATFLRSIARRSTGHLRCVETVETDSPSPRAVVVENDPAGSSTVVVEWTIAGLKDPNECIKAQAGSIEISIDNAEGPAYYQSCTEFATSVALDPGTYSATAVLLDANGIPRTTALAIAPFTLQGNDSLTIPIDFPSDSFR